MKENVKDFFVHAYYLRVMNFEAKSMKHPFRSLALIMQLRLFQRSFYTFRRDFDNDYDYYLSSHHTPTL